jgi:hypothetical protein
MSSGNPQSLAGRVCFCLLLFAIGLYVLAAIREIDRDLKHDSDWRTYFTKDAMHYYVAAQAFASGDFSMSYEKGWPYRQPLFPLLIAGVMKATNDNLVAIRMINVGVIVFAAITLFVILKAFWQDSAAAAIISILFVLNPFVYDQAIHGLNREPLHLFLLIWIITCLLRYIAVRDWIYLLLLAFTIGLDYLDRINGLFLAISAVAVLLCFALSQYFFRPEHRAGLSSDLSSEALAKEEASPTMPGKPDNADAPVRPYADTPTRRHAVYLVALPHRRARLGYYHRAKLALAFALFR